MKTLPRRQGQIHLHLARQPSRPSLNTVYLGLNHHMAETAEEISASTQCANSLPSDDVVMHRMCGWALKSMKDNLVIQAANPRWRATRTSSV